MKIRCSQLVVFLLIVALLPSATTQLLANASSIEERTQVQTLHSMIWRHRLILFDMRFFANAEQLAIDIRQHRAAFSERKLNVIWLVNGLAYDPFSSGASQFDPDEISSRLHNKPSILIGLDGGTKAFYTVTNDRIDFQRLFADIDEMPMRKAGIN